MLRRNSCDRDGFIKHGVTLVVWGREVFSLIFWTKRDTEHDDHYVTSASTQRGWIGFRGKVV